MGICEERIAKFVVETSADAIPVGDPVADVTPPPSGATHIFAVGVAPVSIRQAIQCHVFAAGS